MITARTHWHSSRDIMNRDKQNTTCYISHVSAYISHFFIQYLEAKVEAVLITVFNVQLTHSIKNCELEAKRECPHVQAVCFGDVFFACS